MVRALDGDSTMTSLVPWPSLAAALALVVPAWLPPPPLAFETFEAVAAAFVFAVSVLAGTLFPSLHPRCARLTVPVVTRRPAAATIGPVRCVPSGSPEYAADFSTAGRMAGELEHNRTDGRV